jgi:hypothetical protein
VIIQRRIVATALAAGLLVLGVRTAANAADPELTCQYARYAAAGKYAACQQKARAKLFAGGTNAGHNSDMAKCHKKYLKTWTKMQAKAAGTDSTCDALRLVAGTETVVDNLTGLEWQRTTNDGGIRDKDDTYTWSTILGAGGDGTAFTSFLATLNTSPCFAGHCDWRMPTIDELFTIVNQGFQCFTSPCLDQGVFGPTNPTSYWSVTPDVHQLGDAVGWYIFFHDSLVIVDLKTNAHAVRAVRGQL